MSKTHYGEVWAETIGGTDGDDYLSGLADRDTIDGGAGEDTVYGGSWADSLMGGAGNDEIRGDGGFDYLDGGAGRDALYGGTYADTLIGGQGNDDLFGGNGFDTLDMTEGWDHGNGGKHGDTYIVSIAPVARAEVFEQGWGEDIIIFTDTDAADIIATIRDDDLVISDDGYAGWGSVTIHDAFSHNGGMVETFVFADTTLTLDDVLGLA